MTIKIIRIIAVLCGVLASALVLPGMFRAAFTPSSNRQFSIDYSEVLRDFIISEYNYERGSAIVAGGMKYYDRQGNNYDRDDLSGLLPLDNVSQLAFEGRFPDSVCGVAVTPAMVSQEAFTIYYSADPAVYYGLFELRDRKSYTSKELEPADLFRIGDRGIEFIVSATNSVDAAKSRLFNDALKAKGFTSPARHMWTPVNNTESELLGYYVTDADGELFLLSMDSLRPVVERLPLPDGKTIRNVEFSSSPDFRAVMITDDGDTYLQFHDGQCMRLPLPDARDKALSMSGNLFFRTFRYSNATEQGAYVFDREFRSVDSHALKIQSHPLLRTRIGRCLFPFTVAQTQWNGFRMRWSPPGSFMWLNMVLAAGAAFLLVRRGRSMRDAFTIADTMIILVFGVYGAIGVAAFPQIRNKPVKTKKK